MLLGVAPRNDNCGKEYHNLLEDSSSLILAAWSLSFCQMNERPAVYYHLVDYYIIVIIFIIIIIIIIIICNSSKKILRTKSGTYGFDRDSIPN